MNAEFLKRMVRSFKSRDDDAFVLAVQKLAESERKIGHVHLAEEILKILSNGNASPPTRQVTTMSPPRGKGDAAPLVDVRASAKSLRDIVLDEATSLEVNRILEEFSKKSALAEYGLQPKTKLLFFGPPGNGKTLCAEVLAGELDLPLFYVRFDSLIASYLGETAANLRRVFEFATHGLGILFFDEFDAIGKSRDDHEDVGELKRVVNSFLQLLDNYHGGGPVIAATNYEKLLDYALWRRFDSLVFFPKPTSSHLVHYFQSRLRPFTLEGFNSEDAATWCDGISFADAAKITTEALKTMVLAGSSKLSSRMFRDAMSRYRTAEEHRMSRFRNPTRSA